MSRLNTLPRTELNTSAIAPVTVPWAAGYSGWFGVVRSGRHPACSTVAALPSSNPGVGPKPSAPADVGSIAVTGRQNRKWYFAYITEMPASAATTFTIAASRALCARSSPRASVTSRSRRLYWRTTFADQNLAIAVSSAVRAVLVALPYVLSSLNAVAQSELDSDGGEPGRNWAASLRTNGWTFAAHGVCGAAYADGVSRQTPGPGVRVGKVAVDPIGVTRPSPVRVRMT